MTRLPALFAVVAFAGGIAAQNNAAERTQAELMRSQRSLQQNRSEVDRLLDARLRHDLGLPAEVDTGLFRVAAPTTTEAMERAQQELRDEDAATAALLERYKKLKGEVDQLQADAKERAKAEQRSREIVVPPANVAPTKRSVQRPSGADPVPPTPAPAGEVAKPRPATIVEPSVVDAGLDPVRGQIQGSQDHQRVAQALFKAGQVLMDRADIARQQGQAAVAKDLDARAKDRIVRAVDELGPLLQEREPTYQSLFYLGRCRELLFRLSQRYDGLSLETTREWQQREQEVREPFLKITARDVVKKGERSEIEMLGPWGMAAQTAMEHFRWINLNGGYDPRAAIEALTWPGERAQ